MILPVRKGQNPDEFEETGPYSVFLFLTRSGSRVDSEHHVSAKTDVGGDSYLQFEKQSTDVPVFDLFLDQSAPGGGPVGKRRFEGYVNDKGRLARLVARDVRERLSSDASRTALAELQPALAMWTLLLGVPIRIGKVVTRCDRSGLLSVSGRAPFPDCRLSPPLAIRLEPRVSMAMELYSRALETHDPEYGLLTLYRAAEILFDLRTAHRKRSRQSSGMPSHRFPDEDAQMRWGKPATEIRGRKFSRVFDGGLREARNRVSHALLGKQNTPLRDITDLNRIREESTVWYHVGLYMVKTLLHDHVELRPVRDVQPLDLDVAEIPDLPELDW